ERLPPMDTRFGNDDRWGTTDRVTAKELADYDAERKNRKRGSPLPLPEPRTLALVYLQKTGFPPQELSAAEPVLNAAQANAALEKQITGPAPGAAPGPQ